MQYTGTAHIDKKEEVLVIAQKLNSIKDSSSMGKWGGLGQNLNMEKPKFPNLLILEDLKSHFINPDLIKS